MKMNRYMYIVIFLLFKKDYIFVCCKEVFKHLSILKWIPVLWNLLRNMMMYRIFN